MLASGTMSDQWKPSLRRRPTMPGKSTPLLKASSFTSQTLDRFYPEDGADLPGVSMQLAKLQHIRFSPGCLSIWTGQNGHGKSLMLNQFALDVIQSGEKVAIASFEMSAGRTLQRLVRKLLRNNLNVVFSLVV